MSDFIKLPTHPNDFPYEKGPGGERMPIPEPEEAYFRPDEKEEVPPGH